jgi:hypothetical protein
MTPKTKTILKVLSDKKYFQGDCTEEFRVKHARYMLKDLLNNLKQADQLQDTYPSKQYEQSYTPGVGTSFPNSQGENKAFNNVNSQDSAYQTAAEMKSKLLEQGYSEQQANLAVMAAFPSEQDNYKSGRDLQDKVNVLRSKLLNKGFGTAASLKIASDFYKIKREGSTVTEVKNIEGGKVKTTLSIPKVGEIKNVKQANLDPNDPPAYVVFNNLEKEWKNSMLQSGQIKSASTDLPESYVRMLTNADGDNAKYAAGRRAKAVEELRERQNESNLRSAAEKSSKPKWASSLRVFDRYT